MVIDNLKLHQNVCQIDAIVLLGFERSRCSSVSLEAGRLEFKSRQGQ